MSDKFTILTTSPGFATKGDLAQTLADAGAQLIRHTSEDDQLLNLAGQADYLVAGLPSVDASFLGRAINLKAVLKHGVGLDSIDIQACTARKIPVLSTPGANARAVAEMALGAIFAVSRNLVQGHISVTSGKWDRRVGREVGGATLGIIGLGQIGQALAGMAKGIGMDVIAHDPWVDTAKADALGVRLADFDETLSACDYLSVHVAGGPETRGLIGEREMGLMKPGAAVLNFARGGIVDLQALKSHLDSGHISGAAIDAYDVEPPDTSHPIFQDPRVIFSPHSGADTTSSLIRMGQMVIDDILALRRGETPIRTVNKAELGL